MGLFSATGAERLSLGYQPVTKTGAALFLSAPQARSRSGDRGSCRPPSVGRRITNVGLLILRQESKDVVGGLARLRRRADDSAVVLAQDLGPGADVIGMPHGRHDAEGSAAERRRNFRHQFLERILLRSEGAGEVAIQAVRRSAGVANFVQGRAVPIYRLEIGL